MNLFVIPSWYPSQFSPIAGVFTQEQIEAVAALRSDVRVIVSLWGHGDTELTIRNPCGWYDRILWRIKRRKSTITEHNGISEILTPKIHWNIRLPYGGARQLVNVNRKNFLLATREYGPIDIIHAHVSYPAGYIAYELSKEFGVPYVITEHMGPFPFRVYMRGCQPIPEIVKAFEHASATVAVSPTLSERIKSYGFKAPQVIPNMVDERRFMPQLTRRQKTVFFTLCTISTHKGIDCLLKAIALWNPPSDLFEFRIGGEGPMRIKFQKMSKRMGLENRVIWLGGISRDRAPSLFSECQVFVMPSKHETFGVVYAEAIASGKPIIATRCGGPEYIVNETNGTLVNIGDVEGLSQAMQYMGEHWNQYDTAAIRKDFEVRFSRTAVVRQLHELYTAVLRAE